MPSTATGGGCSTATIPTSTSGSSRYAYSLTCFTDSTSSSTPLEGLGSYSNGNDHQQQQQLERIYQSYAELYPNPLLIQERSERDRLLHEVRRERHEEKLRKLAEQLEHNPLPVVHPKKDRSSQSFFASLFGWGTNKQNVNSDLHSVIDDENDSIQLEEEYLVYSTDTDSDCPTDDTALLGTQSSIDLTCVPQEAHAMARFQLASPSAPIIVRRDPSYPILVIIAWGVVAELVDGVWRSSYTSDKGHWERLLGSQPDDLRKTRATFLGTDCLAISWGGLQDILFYRRQQGGGGGGGNSLPSSWDAVAFFVPTPAVLHNFQTRAHGLANDDLLRVTDIVTLMVETGNEGMFATTVVVSRLGGYVELVPIDDRIWRQSPQSTKKKKKPAADLIQISPENSNIASLTVAEHLDDLLHLEVYRTDVGIDTEWNDTAEYPPAEYLMVASGSKADRERLTFWAVATVFSEDPQQHFSVHMSFLQEYDTGSPSYFTIFADQRIMDHWRKPRRVTRRRPNETQPAISNSQRNGTISAPRPVISMRFKLVGKRLLLSVLSSDGGGIVVLDCTVVMKQAAQLSPTDKLDSVDSTGISIAMSHGDIMRHLSDDKIQDVGWGKRGELVLATTKKKLRVLPVDFKSLGSNTSPMLALPSWLTGATKLGPMHDHLILLLPRKSSLLVAELQPSIPGTILATCNKRLWEQTRRLDILANVPDDVYIIQQVEALFRREFDVKDFDISSCIEACRIAIGKISTLRVAAALQMTEDVETLRTRFDNWATRAGTYSLLCRHFSANEDVTSFLDKFVPLKLVDLATALATKGDTEGLRILVTRHAEELMHDRLVLLEKIPLTIHPSEYSDILGYHDVPDGEVTEPPHSTTWIADRSQRVHDVLGTRPSDDNALLSYFLSLLGRNNAMTMRDVQQSFGACVAVANASRSSLRKSQRMIKSRVSLMNLFLSVIEQLAHCVGTIKLFKPDARYLVDRLWRMYECLPMSLAPDERSDEKLVELTNRVDAVYRSLIASDILADWSPQASFEVLVKKNPYWSEIATTLCSSFCEEVCSRHSSFESKARRLRDLTSDLLQLKADVCQSTLDLESPVHDVLLMGLLHQGEFELFAEVFSTELRHIADWERIQSAVLNFVNEIMVGNASSRFSVETDRVKLAIQCEDVLASRFPQLRKGLKGMRRHLDAAYFINTVLGSEGSTLSPFELRAMVPFDVVEYVLRENPLCALRGSEEWKEPDFARERNRELISYFLAGDSPASTMPTLPGRAIIELANIVGLESRLAHSIVQSRVAYYAHQESMPWIAAALALVMLFDKEVSIEWNELTIATLILAVSDESYDDVAVKSLLCREALRLTPIQNGASLESVIDSYGVLEHKLSRFCPSSWQTAPVVQSQNKQENTDFLVFRAVGALANTAKTMGLDRATLPRSMAKLDRVLSHKAIDRIFQDIRVGYSADLNNLFQILQFKASNGESDDPLLIAIGRFCMFWCISNSVSIVEHLHHGTFDQADAFANLALAASVFLHVHDRQAVLSNINEMQDIAEKQSFAAIDHVASFPRLTPIRPDLAIVRKLMELGYTENGARRAAIATNNESQQAAIVWAVAHSLEPTFNQPVVFVKRQMNPQVDQSAILNVKQCLDSMKTRIHGSDGATTTSNERGFDADFDFDALFLSLTPKIAPKAVAQGTADNVLLGSTHATRSQGIKANTGSSTFKVPIVKAAPGRNGGSKDTLTNVDSTQNQSGPGGSLTKLLPEPPRKAVLGKSRDALKQRPVVPGVDDAINVVLPSPPSRRTPPRLGSMPLSKGVEMNTVAVPSSISDTLPLPPTLRPVPRDEVNKAVGHTTQPFLQTTSTASTISSPSITPKTNSAAAVRTSQRVPPPPFPPPPPIPPPPPRPPPSAPRSAPALLLDRSHLRLTGESVRQNSRGISNRLDHDERKRLLNKGRELFEQVRPSPTNASSPRYTFGTISPTATTNAIQSRELFGPSRSVPMSVTRPTIVEAAEAASPLRAEINDDLPIEEGTDGWDFEDF